MMEFITGIEPRKKCAICNETFFATATSNSYPYDDYSCSSCNWSATICPKCATKNCPKCGAEIESSYNKAPDDIIY